MNYTLPEANKIKNRINDHNPAFFDINDYVDYVSDTFDHYVITECSHFIEIQNAGLSGECNAFMDVMRDI